MYLKVHFVFISLTTKLEEVDILVEEFPASF